MTDFETAKLNDFTVSRMIRLGMDLEQIVGQLALEKAKCVQRIIELETIAPRKIIMPDGKIMIWQCPAELIPTPNSAA